MQPSSQQPMLTAPSSANLTTEQIQKMLDENKKLILAILENQNMGRIAECAQYQVVLQKNLMYLAAIADAQPPPATPPAQTPSHPVTQQGNYMQHPQSGMGQQQFFGAKSPFQMNSNLQQQQPQLHFVQQQQQQSYQQGQVGMRPNNAMYQAMQSGFGGGGSGSFADAQGSAQDGSDAPSGRGE